MEDNLRSCKESSAVNRIIRLGTKMGNTRQIDTGIGIITGGVIGWFHHKWYIWLMLFLILILWGYLDSQNKA